MGSTLEINLDRIIENIKAYKKRMYVGQKFCAVVKADAYGFGSKRIARVINDDVDYFAVSSRKEFFEIKRFVTKPILILDPIYKNITILARNDCEFCVSNLFQLDLNCDDNCVA